MRTFEHECKSHHLCFLSKIEADQLPTQRPPFILVPKSNPPVVNSVQKASALSARCRKFRERAGAISWDGREGSDKIKAFIENIVKPVDNSTRASRDLTEDELGGLRLVNLGDMPSRARAGTTQESKQKYIAATRKAAGATSPTGTGQEEDEEMEEAPQVEAQGTGLEAHDQVEETQRVEPGEPDLEPPERQSDQEPSNRGWEVNYLLDSESLYYDSDHADQFVENPLAPEGQRKHQYSRK